MKINKTKQEQILSHIGLQIENGILSYEKGHFSKYISTEYMNSERKQTDEIYRMSEYTLLHSESGLRIVYTETEGYYGDTVEYKVIDIFIITQEQNRLDVVDVDFNKKVFITPSEIIPFAKVDALTES